MSYTNETTYYGLPLPTGSDKSAFTDNNTAFQAVDAALHTAAEQSGAATEDIVTIKADIVDLKAADVTIIGDIDAAEINIEALQQKELLQDAAIDAVKADAFDMITAYNEPTATSAHAYNVGDFFIYNDVLYKATESIAIGDTIVPDTNCTTTNVTSELIAVDTSLSDIAPFVDFSDVTAVSASANYVIDHIIASRQGKVVVVSAEVTFNADYTGGNSILKLQDNRGILAPRVRGGSIRWQLNGRIDGDPALCVFAQGGDDDAWITCSSSITNGSTLYLNGTFICD